MTAAITADGLRATYGDHVVLDGLDLHVPAGTVTALLGPNGAGKTTTVNVLATLLTPAGGRASVAGHDVVAAPAAVRRAIGVTGQLSAVDELLTGAENLRLMARLHHLSRADAATAIDGLLERVDLIDAADRAASTYSGGMRRRLDLAMTLVGRPSVLFLDEPTTGLDPRSRRALWALVRELVRDGTTVLLTTQYLEEADRLADHVVVLDGGRLVAEGTPDALKRQVPGGHVGLRFADEAALDRARGALPDGTVDADSLRLQVPYAGDVASLRAVLRHLDDHGVEPEDLTVHTPDLDDVFLALTGTAPSTPTTS